MSTIHIARDSETLGTFSIEEITTGLNTGRFFTSDLHWHAGLSEWKPLSEFSAIIENISAARPEPAWERRQETGLIKAYASTIFTSAFRPRSTFTDLRKDSSATGAIGFYAINLIAATAISCAGIAAIPTLAPTKHPLAEKLLPDTSPEILEIFGTIGSTLFALILTAMTLVTAHFLLKGLASDDPIGEIKTTAKAYLYPAGAITLLSAIPLALLRMTHEWAPIAALSLIGIAQWVITAIALARAHRTSTGKCLATYFLARLIISIAIGMIWALIIGITLATTFANP